MPLTPEEIGDVHAIAAQLRKANRPVWAETIDVSAVFHDDNMSFPEKRDAIVAALKSTAWYRSQVGDDGYPVDDPTGNASGRDGLWWAVDELGDVTDADEFDVVWDGIYDLADYARVWIRTT